MTTKYFFQKIRLLSWLLLITLGATAQNKWTDERWKKTDSLQKILPNLKDTARVNQLFRISQMFYGLNSDSAKRIANTAYHEALTIKYYAKVAEILKWQSDLHFWLGEMDQAIEIGKSALPFYEKINDRVGLAKMYTGLGLKFRCALKFSEALNVYNKSIQIMVSEKHNEEQISYCYEGKGDVFSALGIYDSAYLSFNKALQISQGIQDDETRTDEIVSILKSIASLFRGVGDMKMFGYYRDQISQYKVDTSVWGDDDLVETNLYFQQFDSAYFYWNRYQARIGEKPRPDDLKMVRRIDYIDTMHLGRIHAGLKNYDSAIIYLEAVLPYFIKSDRVNIRFDILQALAGSYFGKGNYQVAITHANHLVQLSEKHGLKPQLQDGYKLLSEIYEKTGNKNSANLYYRKYSEMKDEIKTDEFKQKLKLYKAEEEEKRKTGAIKQLQKEKQWLSIGMILLAISIASIFSFIWVQRKYNAKKRLLEKKELALKQAEDERRIASLEMMALRSQMNPHFIFNCLNSINRFVLRNDNEAASNYLTKFSKLMRMVLENSKQALIPLEDEVKCLELYIQMEQFRCRNSFRYYVKYHDGVNVSEAMIAPLLLQPFVENAIWHGLSPKDDEGQLGIEFMQKEETLYCVIRDNGIGRKKASELKSQLAEHHKSMGLQITKERLAAMGINHNNESPIEVEDLYDERGWAAGTKVTIRIYSLPEFEELKSSLNL